MFQKLVAIEPVSLVEEAEKKLYDYAKEVVLFTDIPGDDEEIIRRIGDADAVLVSYTSRINSYVMERCPNIKYVGMCCSLYGPDSANVDIRAAQEPCTVLVIVDAVSRKYFTSETSWLWDIDFDQLNAPQVQRIILSGRYCNDLAERFSFTDIPREKVTVQADIPAAAAELKADGSENVYVVTCFSDRDKILSQVVKEA